METNVIQKAELTPGEARNRQRQRRQIVYIGITALFGGMVGFATGFFDQGDGNLFAGDWESLSLPPGIAIALAVALIGAFIGLPLYGFIQIDDYKREMNLVAFTGGMLAVLAGFPIWAVLYAGGFAPPPHAFGVFAIGFASMFVAYLVAWWRG